ncbi:MAG: hypothetical protein HY877_02025, partial [Deltaproteobacteria bacterium]|nr:hypothetical protein [Deltaproteobacteria bacterium]
GLALFDDLATDTAEQDFELFSIGSESFINSANPVRVRIDTIQKTSTDTDPVAWQIQGRVVQLASGDTLGCSADGVSGVKRIQVYAADSSNDGKKHAKFLSYIVPIGANGMGVDTSGSYNKGAFSFVLKPSSDFGLSSIGLISLVPELSSNNIGGSSRLLEVKETAPGATLDCGASGVSGSGSGSGGSNPGAQGGDYIRLGYKTQQKCKLAKPIGTLAPLHYDSDGDGIDDRDEDINGNCECDAGEYSCWMKPDTDGDGIPDSAERLGGTINHRRWDSVSKRFDPYQPFCGHGIIPSSHVSVADLCDVNGDGQSNASSDMSDNDSLRDYQEDRARVFIPGAKAHFYIWGGIGNLVPYRDKDNVNVECTQILIDAGKSDVGAKYGIYRVKNDFSGLPVEHDFIRSVGANENLMALVCRNDSVRSETNFDGAYESNAGETSPYLDDTNGDGVNDDVCAGTMTNSVCQLTCVPYEIFKNLPDKYVAGGATGSHTTLQLDTDNVPLLFKESAATIRNLCTDIDRDGIPDCVENPTGQCNFGADVNGGKILNPYSKDTDGDGVPDAIDLDPFHKDALGIAGGDVYPSDDSGMTDTQRNALRSVFLSNKYLMLFVDRDQDGLKDGEEDNGAGALALNGIYEPVRGLAGISTTETDPLKKDTDEDNISDLVEVKQWHTNPANIDTDDDGLPDSIEVKGDSPTASGDYGDQSGAGCETFVKIEPGHTKPELVQMLKNNRITPIGTNPLNPDTDGDGIKDGIEVTGVYSKDADVFGLIRNGFPAEGIDMVSNPLAKDSDGDGLADSQEYGTSGIMDKNSSNPCAKNTDHDGIISDKDEKPGCATNSDLSCLGPSDNGVDKGIDSDGDGLSDVVEDLNQNGRRDPGETDAFNPDSDGDHLSDGIEKQLGTDPLKADSDGDCISDDKELGLTDATSLKAAMSTVTIRMANGQIKTAQVVLQISYSPGANTNPMSADTDGDGLCDGNNPVPRADGTMECIRGEDLNCNGILDKDAKNPNILLETDSRNPDTDSDGANDKQEMCAGGTCNLSANIGNATTGRSTGCFSLTGNDPLDPASMLYVFGVLVMLNRIFRLSLRKHSCHSERSEESC